MKIKEFQSVLRKKGVDFALFVNMDFSRFDYDMAYFSGYGGVGVLIVPKDKAPFLVVSRFEKKRAQKGGLLVYSPTKSKRLSLFTHEVLTKNKVNRKKVGIDKGDFTLLLKDIFKKTLKIKRFVDLRKDICKIRLEKTKKEIEIIKKGCAISDGIMEKCIKNLKKFKTEAEVKAYLEYEARKKGCELAFPTIVASGANSSKAHHSTEDINLKKGFCVIDFGIRYMNYCTDTTRTIYLGKPTEKEKEIYGFVLNVQKKIIRNIKLGGKCSSLFYETTKELGKYGKYFTHGLGHGFGIKVHELPNLADLSKDKIKNNTVFTIEPGIYLKEFGIRIEDDILIENSKVKILTKVSKELVVIA